MKTKGILLVLIAAVAASAGWLLFRQQKAQASVARITRDGLLIEEIDLERVTEHRPGGAGPDLCVGSRLPRPDLCEAGVDFGRNSPHRLPAPQAGD